VGSNVVKRVFWVLLAMDTVLILQAMADDAARGDRWCCMMARDAGDPTTI
jgi:hypothetical protein